MKLQIESPQTRNITPTCEASGETPRFTLLVLESETTEIFAPLSHRAVVRARRRRRGFGGPLQLNQPTEVQPSAR